MQKVLIGIVAFIALLAGLIAVVPGLIDWNTYKTEITRQVENLTGRKLIIDGDIEMTVLPAPTLTVSGVRFTNAPWSSAEYMVRLSSLEVSLVLGPLLGGEIQVQKVRAVDPVVLLEVDADGRQNWIFESSNTTSGASIDLAPETESPSGFADGSGPGIQLDNVEIVNAAIIYRDAVSGTSERLDQVNATLKAGSLQGPFESVGTMVVHGIPVSYEAVVDGIFQGRTVPVSATVRSETGGAQAEISGNIVNLAEDPRFKGTVQAEGTSLAALLHSVAGLAALPGLANQAFDMSATVEASATAANMAATLTDLVVKLGDTTINGSLTAELGDEIVADSSFAVSHVDIDRILALAPFTPATGDAVTPETKSANSQSTETATSATTAATTSATAAAAATATPLIPANITATTSLVVDALTYKGEKAGPVRLNAEAGNSEITLSQFSAQLPGATDMALFGFLNHQNGVPVFEGDSEISIGNTRRLARWLGIDLSQIPKGRLRHLSATATIRATPEQVQITGVNAAFDRSNLSGGITLALQKRLAFGASIGLDRINLSAYLPSGDGTKTPEADAAAATSGDSPESTRETSAQTSAQTPPAAGPLPDLAALSAFDANLGLNVGEIVHNGRKIRDVAVSGSLIRGDLNLEKAVANLAGARMSMSGAINDLGGNPKFGDLKIAFRTDSLGPVLNMLAVKSPVPPKVIGPVAVEAVLDGSALQPAVTGTFQALGATADINGRLSSLPVKPAVNAAVSLRHGDTARLLKNLGVAYRPAGKIGGLEVSAKISGDTDAINLSDMNVRQGDVNARGSAAIDLTGVPNIAAVLQAGDIVVDPFLPVQQAGRSGSDSGSGGGGAQNTSGGSGSAASGASGAPWSDEPLDLSVLQAVNADIRLNASSVRYDRITAENIAAHILLQDGVLTASDVKGALFGGTFGLKGLINARQSTPSLQADLDFSNGNVSKLLGAFTGEGTAVGALSLGGTVTSVGNSVAAMVSDLDGTAAFSMTDLDVKGAGRGTPLAGLTDLVLAIGQLGSGLGGASADGLADIGGGLAIADGVARLENFTLASGFGNGTAGGFVDLGDWNMDVAGELQIAQNLLTAILANTTGGLDRVPFTVRGPLDSPVVDLETGSLLGGGDGLLPQGLGTLLQGVLGGGASGNTAQQQPPPSQSGTGTSTGNDATNTESEPESQQQQQQQQQQQTISPEQLLEQLLGF